MWELIRANQQKSMVLFVLMAFCLLALGYALGAAIDPESGSLYGLSAAGLIWIALTLVSYFSGDRVLLSASNATEITPDVHPQLFNVVEEMKIAANLPKIPRIYVIDDEQPNAFATGRDPEHASVAVTTGLLTRLTRDELQGVIAHEISHILNRDILYMTCAGVMLGSVSIFSEIFLRGFRGVPRRRYRGSGRSGDQTNGIFILIAVAAAILAPILVRLLYFSLSRRREYLADASGARLTRYPEGLASALEKISGVHVQSTTANQVTAPMYIINPLQLAGSAFSSIFSTHPPTTERIQILRNMSQGVNFLNYEQAFQKIKGSQSRVLPPSAREDADAIATRAPTRESIVDQEVVADDSKLSNKATVRHVGDLRRAVNHYAFVACQCGLKFKFPPNLDKQSVLCPRCFSQVQIPLANQLAESNVSQYERSTKGWESFKCDCGHLVQLSPNFIGSRVECAGCKKTIHIRALA